MRWRELIRSERGTIVPHAPRPPRGSDLGYGFNPEEYPALAIYHSIHYVRVQTPSRLLSFPWQSAQEFLARCIEAYPTVHPLVQQFRAVGVSRPVDLTDPADQAFALGVIEGWSAQVGEDELPIGISELANALRDQTEEPRG
jgi:hypothetical protein